MTPQVVGRKRHRNDERTVHCPIEGCEETPLARGVHLHVRQSSGDGHGPQGDVPDGVTFDELETAGAETVEMDYPEERRTEAVARICPYCEQPFTGKQGVLIHLGQMRGKTVHPREYADIDPDEFPIAHLDERGDVRDIIEGGTVLPATEHRLEEGGGLDPAEIVEALRDTGEDEAADRVAEMIRGH